MFIKIINKLIPLSFQEEIKKLLNSDNFPWYFYNSVYEYDKEDKINLLKYNKKIINSYAMIHTAFILPKGINSMFFETFNKILPYLEKKENIKIKEILRIRIRKTFYHPCNDSSKYNIPHVDIKDDNNFKSLIYYPENSDGDSVFFKEKTKDKILYSSTVKEIKRIKPKQGSAIFFDGNIFHSGNCPIKENKRIVVNFDFKI